MATMPPKNRAVRPSLISAAGVAVTMTAVRAAAAIASSQWAGLPYRQ